MYERYDMPWSALLARAISYPYACPLGASTWWHLWHVTSHVSAPHYISRLTHDWHRRGMCLWRLTSHPLTTRLPHCLVITSEHSRNLPIAGCGDVRRCIRGASQAAQDARNRILVVHERSDFLVNDHSLPGNSLEKCASKDHIVQDKRSRNSMSEHGGMRQAI